MHNAAGEFKGIVGTFSVSSWTTTEIESWRRTTIASLTKRALFQNPYFGSISNQLSDLIASDRRGVQKYGLDGIEERSQFTLKSVYFPPKDDPSWQRKSPNPNWHGSAQSKRRLGEMKSSGV
jgi:hypothetical protein